MPYKKNLKLQIKISKIRNAGVDHKILLGCISWSNLFSPSLYCFSDSTNFDEQSDEDLYFCASLPMSECGDYEHLGFFFKKVTHGTYFLDPKHVGSLAQTTHVLQPRSKNKDGSTFRICHFNVKRISFSAYSLNIERTSIFSSWLEVIFK